MLALFRYFACGSSRDDLHIQSIMNEGEAEMNLMGVRGEKFVTGSKQVSRTRKEQRERLSQRDLPLFLFRI